ncbi:hypothetical protein [Actinomadura rubrisoli]|uniref:hypothetical protein n=1 Tax=Actinomadura rubrisoli TaxID=2530368 RepID=UPI001A9F5C08|nr:hypothetical protein [Actinomadura rubrisoli]
MDFVVASAKAYSGASPFFDETATRTLGERDVARTRNIASTLTNHYLPPTRGPASTRTADRAAAAEDQRADRSGAHTKIPPRYTTQDVVIRWEA